jgi:pimeloyl-ACP methyl ester carboxylesterase
VREFLDASGLTAVDQSQAEAGFQRARALERELPDPAAALMHDVNERHVSALGARLLPHVGAFGTDPALSPEHSAPPTVPVFLLHGTDDNVIPAAESRLLAGWLRGRTAVRAYYSQPLTHASVDARATLADYWGLIVFWRALLQ